jgi:hypothetical protein
MDYKILFDKSLEYLLTFKIPILFYLGWIIIHYIASHLYCYICTPYSLYGFLISPFQSSSPLCIGLRWIINEAGTIISKMWYIFGAWLSAKLYFYKSE